MTATLEALENRMQAAVTLVAACPVVWENQNGPRPAGAYVSLFGPRYVRESEPEEQTSELVGDANNVAMEQRFFYAVFVTVTAHSIGAYDRALRISRQLYSAGVRAQLAELALIGTEDVLHSPQLLEAQFEERAQFQMQLRVALAEVEVAPVIRKANVEAVVSPPGG